MSESVSGERECMGLWRCHMYYRMSCPSPAFSRSLLSSTTHLSVPSLTLHLSPCTPHPAPLTLYPSHCTPHPAPLTLYPAPCTPHPVPCTPHLLGLGSAAAMQPQLSVKLTQTLRLDPERPEYHRATVGE